jgi:hypothetical protein
MRMNAPSEDQSLRQILSSLAFRERGVRAWRLAPACGVDEGVDGVDDQFRLVELDPMRAAARDDMAAGIGRVRQALMYRELFGRLIAARNDNERHLTRRSHRRNDLSIAFQCQEMIGHCVEALGIAPQRLHDGMNLGRKLSHFTDQPFQRSCRRGSKHPDELPRRLRRATGEQRQARTDHPDMREQRADT